MLIAKTAFKVIADAETKDNAKTCEYKHHNAEPSGGEQESYYTDPLPATIRSHWQIAP